MKPTAILLCVLLSVPFFAFGDSKCTDRPKCWPEGSAMHTGLLRRQSEEKLSLRLQKHHKELVALISTKEIIDGVEYLEDQLLVEAVQSQQKAWMQYVGYECGLIGALSSGASIWQGARSAECAQNLTSQRLKRMQSAVRCIKRISPADRKYNQQSCLYQLAPLAVPIEK